MVSSFLSKGFFLLLKLLPYKGFFSWFPKYWKYHIYSWKKKTVPNHHCLLVTAKLHHEVFATFLSSLKNKYGKTGTQIQMRKTKKYLWILASLILALRGWPVSGSFYSAFVPPFATTAATVLSIWYCPTPELTWKSTLWKLRTKVTPLMKSEALTAALNSPSGREVLLKLDNLQPAGRFTST